MSKYKIRERESSSVTQAVYTTMPEVFCMLAAVILFLCMDQEKA